MADKSFGVKELKLLNASGTPTVTSPNNLNLNANTVAISTSATVGNNLTVTSTTNSANLNVTGIGTLTRAFATDLSVSGISTISQPSNANPHSLWDVVNNGSSAYRFTGPGQSGDENNPNIYLVRGQRYIFKVNASGHPFQLRVANGGAAYSDGVTNNGAQSGNVVINVQHDAPAQLYYQCTNHGSMVGNIYIVGGPQVISGVVTATTFSGAVSGTTGTFSGDVSITDKIVHTGDTDTAIRFAGNDIITAEIAGTETFRIDGTGLKIVDKLLHSGDIDTMIRFPAGDTITAETNGVERLRITSDGKIGISRTPTQHPLEIQHASEPTVSFWRGSTKGAALQSQSGGTYLYSYQNAPLLFSVNSASGYTERLRITSDGALGTNSTVRSAYGGLDLCAQGATNLGTLTLGAGGGQNGQSRSSNQENQFRIMMPTYANPALMTTVLYGSSGSGGHDLHYGGGTGWAYATNSHRFFTAANQTTGNGTERLRITSAGQVSIGNAISGMGMGFGNQLLSARSDTYSAGIFGSNGSALTALIVYADHASYAANMQDWRSLRSNNSAFNFLRCSSNSAADNEFFIGGDGVVYSDGGTTMQSPADYAEMFEWSDGNSSDEDRRGYTVVLDGNKVRIATSSDSTDNIIGVVSGNPAVLADNAWDRWAEKYQKDDYNCYVRNSDGDRILNSSYDDTQTYVPREDRKEWDAIGMVGKLRVRKGQQTGTRWLKMRDVSDSIEEWLVR